MSNYHAEHCINCFKASCKFEYCPVSKCKYCLVLLHNCKLEEHIAEVCRWAHARCPNFINGCDIVLHRAKISAHISNCVASTVVCSRDRCRKLNAKSCKMQLKHMGRERRVQPVEDYDDLDIKLTAYDQNLIVESYNSSRPKRVKQRDPLHPAHPLIPLRNTPFDNSEPSWGLEDSSEDELREKREKLRKSRLVFSNCFMCQIDPAAQHLHTLGNGTDIEKIKKRRMTVQTIDEFHCKLNLKVSINVENVPESILKDENIREIKKGGTFYTLKCLKTVRRNEYGAHCLSQHTQSVDQMNEMIVRCPNWMRGCQFSSSRIEIENGKLRFHAHSATLTYQPSSNFPVLDVNLENLPLCVFEVLATFLPSSSLYNLSLTSKKLRSLTFIGCKTSRCYVEPTWVAGNIGHWVLKGFTWRISDAEPPPALRWRVPIELSHHLSQCSFFEPVNYKEEMVPVFPQHLKNEIWNGFSNALSENFIYDELRDIAYN